VHSRKRPYGEEHRARLGGAPVSWDRARRRAQEPVLRPLLDRFFTRHEADGGGWEWSRSREQARARLILVPQLSPYSSTTHASGSPCSKHAQARLTAPRGMPLMRFSEHARGAAAPREPAAAGRWPAPAGRAGREPARAAALTAAPPRSRAQAQALLLHVLIVALVAEGGELGAAQFERLRAALRAAPADLAGLYRCAPPGAGRGRAGAWAGQRLVGGGLWPARPRVATLHGPDAPFCSAALLPANRAWAICPRAWLATRPIKLSAAQASCVGEAGAAAPARN
jgi:hypothetical protein